MNDTPTPSKVSGIKITLAIVPALLILSIIIALYLGANEEQETQGPIEGEVTVPELADYLRKLNGDIIERSFGSERGIRGLKQTWSMIQGTLEPPNLGYEVFRSANDAQAGFLWPTLWINVGGDESSEVTILAVPYGVSGTPVAFSLGLAEYLTSHSVRKNVRLVFYPPLVEGRLRDWIWERVSEEGESLSGFAILKGNGSPQYWAEIQSTDGATDFLEELTNKKGWAQNVIVESKSSDEIIVRLGEKGESPVENHAGRLMRMMPLMKAFLSGIGE